MPQQPSSVSLSFSTCRSQSVGTGLAKVWGPDGPVAENWGEVLHSLDLALLTTDPGRLYVRHVLSIA